MRIIWEVEDGYIGKSAPHYTEIDDDDLEYIDSVEKREEYILKCIQEDFNNKITFSIIRRE